MPYTPSDEHANTTSTPTGRSVSCNAVWCPNIDTVGPNGMTENARNAGTADRIGARKYTGLSASSGMISSLKASFTPSASDCRMPHGPTRFGPMRFCIRPTTLRSKTIENSVMTTRNANTPTTLMSVSHTGWSPKPGRFWPAASTALMTQPPTTGGADGLVSVTIEPCAAPSVARTAQWRALRRQPHHLVGQVGDLDRHDDRAALGRNGDPLACGSARATSR